MSRDRRQYYIDNKEKFSNRAKRRYQEKQDEIKYKNSEYVKNNPEKIISIQRNWYLKNKEIKKEKGKIYRITSDTYKQNHLLQTQNRRALKFTTSDNSINIDNVQLIKEKQFSKCTYCKQELLEFHLDHIMPLSRGGKHTIDNIQLLCPSCNLRKSNKTHEEYVLTLNLNKND